LLSSVAFSMIFNTSPSPKQWSKQKKSRNDTPHRKQRINFVTVIKNNNNFSCSNSSNNNEWWNQWALAVMALPSPLIMGWRVRSWFQDTRNAWVTYASNIYIYIWQLYHYSCMTHSRLFFEVPWAFLLLLLYFAILRIPPSIYVLLQN
jgi:hypothetical protein